MVATSSLLLWQVLTDAYSRLGFDVLGDEAFRAMVLARIVEPTSKADSLRVLAEIGGAGPGLRTLFRSLKRCQDRDYRGMLATACTGAFGRHRRSGALVMYDVTTLHFETGDEDTGGRAAQGRDEQGTPRRPAGPGRAAGRPVRVPARGAPVRGQHRRDHHAAAGPAARSRHATA